MWRGEKVLEEPGSYLIELITSFSELLRKFVFSFKTRFIESENSMVNVIVTSIEYHYLVQYEPGGVIFLSFFHNNS